MLNLLDATDAAHTVALRSNDRLRESQKEKNKQIAHIDEGDQALIASRDATGQIITVWDEQKAKIDGEHAAEIARLAAAAEKAQARWQPMAAVATALNNFAERNGIVLERSRVVVTR